MQNGKNFLNKIPKDTPLGGKKGNLTKLNSEFLWLTMETLQITTLNNVDGMIEL